MTMPFFLYVYAHVHALTCAALYEFWVNGTSKAGNTYFHDLMVDCKTFMESVTTEASCCRLSHR